MNELIEEIIADLIYNAISKNPTIEKINDLFDDLFDGEIEILFGSAGAHNASRMSVVFVVHDATERTLSKLKLVSDFLFRIDPNRGVGFESIKIAHAVELVADDEADTNAK